MYGTVELKSRTLNDNKFEAPKICLANNDRDCTNLIIVKEVKFARTARAKNGVRIRGSGRQRCARVPPVESHVHGCCNNKGSCDAKYLGA